MPRYAHIYLHGIKKHFLTSAQKVPCTFELTVPGLGYLQGNAGEDVRLPNYREVGTFLTGTTDERRH